MIEIPENSTVVYYGMPSGPYVTLSPEAAKRLIAILNADADIVPTREVRLAPTGRFEISSKVYLLYPDAIELRVGNKRCVWIDDDITALATKLEQARDAGIDELQVLNQHLEAAK